MNKVSIVLGISYGDEGKGLTVASLKPDLVVRFDAGPQCGHTTVVNGIRHVFSSFGSGTLGGAPTYWSQNCPFNPRAFYREHQDLVDKGCQPGFYIHPMAPVVTPYDILFNQSMERKRNHGSVGVGFGTTIERNEGPHKFFVGDLRSPIMTRHKLNTVMEYYVAKAKREDVPLIFDKDAIERDFLRFAELAVDKIDNFCTFEEISPLYNHVVFEGNQGILLDQDFGFFPHVTRGYTTSRRAFETLKSVGYNPEDVDMYYVTRSYLTRHGNGPMPGETKIELVNNENETNVTQEFQGVFRKGHLSVELLNHALMCDRVFSAGASSNLVLTCLDQTGCKVLCDGEKMEPEAFYEQLDGIDKVFLCDNPEGNWKEVELRKGLEFEIPLEMEIPLNGHYVGEAKNG